MNKQQITTQGSTKNTGQPTGSYFGNLTDEQITSVIDGRKNLLEGLKTHVSRKIYYQMEEKINSEEARLKEISDWQHGRSQQMARFTFILDHHYFEQEFLQ